MMKWFQKQLRLPEFPRGFHLITERIERELHPISGWQYGQLQVFIQHTSAGLTPNENADPTVRMDFESQLNLMIPEGGSHYLHTLEGPDDMPAHIKASLMGSSLQLPIADGALALGTWQGIYLCEHRNHGGQRKLLLTAWGE